MRIAPAVAIVHLECMMMITQIAIVGTAEQEWTEQQNELVGIENSNKLPIRGDAND